MKIILDIKGNKVSFFMELLKNFSYVKAGPISEKKALLIKEIKEAVREINLVKSGKRNARNAEDFLNELSR